MRSSISGSDTSAESGRHAPASANAVLVLLALIAIFLAGIEIFTRQFVVRMSRVEAREQREYASAAAARPSRGRKIFLLLGNSLMGQGVRADEVRAALEPELDVRRLYVDDTGFYDFFYGMRRLYADGARYNAVFVFLTPRQLIRPGVRGDYFAYRLMLASDALKVARDAGLNRTDASNLFFANVSAFFGLRTEIRKVLLGRLMPGLPALMGAIANDRGAALTDQEIYHGATVRLTAFRELAAAQNSRIILVIPPQIEPEGVEVTKLAGSQAGIKIVTVPFNVTGPSDFSDGFHLNPEGARKYTAALIPELARALQ